MDFEIGAHPLNFVINIIIHHLDGKTGKSRPSSPDIAWSKYE